MTVNTVTGNITAPDGSKQPFSSSFTTAPAAPPVMPWYDKSSDFIANVAGMVVPRLKLHGRLIIAAPNVDASAGGECHGVAVANPGYGVGLIQCDAANVAGAKVGPWLLQPDVPQPWLNGLRGWGFTCVGGGPTIRDVVDGCDIYNNHGAAVNVHLDGDCDQLACFPDASQPDKITHSDAVQWLGGTGVVIRGKWRGMLNPAGQLVAKRKQANSSLMIEQNIGIDAGLDADGEFSGGNVATVNVSSHGGPATMNVGKIHGTFGGNSVMGYDVIMSPTTTFAVTGTRVDGKPVVVNRKGA